MSPGTIRVCLNSIKKLLDMNDVPLVWKPIYGACPELKYGSPGPGWCP